MFTGIIESTAKVLTLKKDGLVLARPAIFDDLKIGCSIAVSGACLSVTKFDEHSMSFDVVPTTFQKTKLGSLQVGDSVNLERALKADGRLEGHIVLGHCEGVGKVLVASRTAPTPGPSPWPFVATATSGKQGEGSYPLSQYNHLRERVWRGTDEKKRPSKTIVEHAREMRRATTIAEKKLWDALKGDKLKGLRFRRQHPVGKFILDFYSDGLKLAIEVDGEIHNDPELKEYETYRTMNVNNRGISVMRFTNKDILHRLNDVLHAISSFSTPRPRRSADPGEGLGDGVFLTVKIPPNLLPYTVLHGSITIDGVALTIASLKDDQVTVAIIPHTLEQTTLGSLKAGDQVNIETDVLGKYILRCG